MGTVSDGSGHWGGECPTQTGRRWAVGADKWVRALIRRVLEKRVRGRAVRARM